MSALDQLDIAGQQDEQAAAVKKSDRAQQQDKDDFKWLMADKRGRRIMWRLLESAGVFRTSFDTSALRMAMLEGQRNYGLTWMNEIMATTPEKFVQMLDESKAT
jgi:hypothetical protein